MHGTTNMKFIQNFSMETCHWSRENGWLGLTCNYGKTWDIKIRSGNAAHNNRSVELLHGCNSSKLSNVCS